MQNELSRIELICRHISARIKRFLNARLNEEMFQTKQMVAMKTCDE